MNKIIEHVRLDEMEKPLLLLGPGPKKGMDEQKLYTIGFAVTGIIVLGIVLIVAANSYVQSTIASKEPEITPTPTITPTPFIKDLEATPSATITLTVTPTPTIAPTTAPTANPTNTPAPTNTPTPSATLTPTESPTPTPTI